MRTACGNPFVFQHAFGFRRARVLYCDQVDKVGTVWESAVHEIEEDGIFVKSQWRQGV